MICVVITFSTVILLRDFGTYIFYLLVGCLVIKLLRDFGSYGTMFMMRVITVALVNIIFFSSYVLYLCAGCLAIKLLRDLGPYGITLITTWVYCFRYPRHSYRTIY
jgi:hypothetical protein